MRNYEELNDLKNIIHGIDDNKKDNKSFNKVQYKFNSYLEFTFPLFSELDKHKELSFNVCFLVIFYFFLQILTDVISSSIEYSENSTLNNLYDKVIYVNQSDTINKTQENNDITNKSYNLVKMIVASNTYKLPLLDNLMLEFKKILFLEFIYTYDIYGGFTIFFFVYILVLIIMSFYILYCLKYFKECNSNVLSLVNILCYLLYFVLIQMFLNLMVSNLVCLNNFTLIYNNNEESISVESNKFYVNNNKIYYNNNTPNVYICYLSKSYQVFIISISLISIVLIYAVSSFICNNFFGVNKYSNKNYYSRMPTNYELVMLNYLYIKFILKIISFYFPSFSVSILITNALYFPLLFYFFYKKIYFYNKKLYVLQKIMIIATCLTGSVSIILKYIYVQQKVIILLFCALLAIPTIITLDGFNRRRILLSFNLETNDNVKMLEKYIDELIRLFKNESNVEDQNLFNGIFQYYINRKNRFKFKKIGNEKYYLPYNKEIYIDPYFNNDNRKKYNYIMLCNLIYDFYDYSIKQIHNNYDLLLIYTYFLKNLYGNRYMTITLSQKTLSVTSNLYHKILINNIIESFNNAVYSGKNNLSFKNLPVLFFYEKLSNLMVNQVVQLCYEQMKFWNSILALEKPETYENSNYYKSLNKSYFISAKKMYKLINNIEKCRQVITKINPKQENNIQKIYRYYKHYLIEDEDFKNKNKLNNDNYNTYLTSKLEKYIRLFEENSCCFIVDISQDVGKIMTSSINSNTMFNYPKHYFKDKNINIIMPSSISKNHNYYLKTFQKTGNQSVVECSDIKVYVKDSSNNALTATLSAYFLPFLDEKKVFTIGNVQTFKNTEEFILLDPRGIIDTLFIKDNDLKIKNNYAQKLNIYIQFLIPSLIDKSSLIFIYNGSKPYVKLEEKFSISYAPIFIPYLLHENYDVIKDKASHSKKLLDYFNKLESLMYNILLSNNNVEERDKLKKTFYNTIKVNSYKFYLNNYSNSITKNNKKSTNKELGSKIISGSDENYCYSSIALDIEKFEIKRVKFLKLLIKSKNILDNKNITDDILRECLDSDNIDYNNTNYKRSNNTHKYNNLGLFKVKVNTIKNETNKLANDINYKHQFISKKNINKEVKFTENLNNKFNLKTNITNLNKNDSDYSSTDGDNKSVNNNSCLKTTTANIVLNYKSRNNQIDKNFYYNSFYNTVSNYYLINNNDNNNFNSNEIIKQNKNINRRNSLSIEIENPIENSTVALDFINYLKDNFNKNKKSVFLKCNLKNNINSINTNNVNTPFFKKSNKQKIKIQLSANKKKSSKNFTIENKSNINNFNNKEFVENALILGSNSIFNNKSKLSNNKKTYKLFGNLNNDTASITSLVSVNSTYSNMKTLQRIRKGILSNKQPKVLHTLKYVFGVTFLILIGIIIYFYFYCMFLNNKIDYYVNLSMDYSNIPEHLACIHNYARNTYLLENNLINEEDYFKADETDYMTFSYKSIANCTYNINNIISQLNKEFDLKKLVISNNVNIDNYNFDSANFESIENNIALYDGLFYIIHTTIDLNAYYFSKTINYNNNNSNNELSNFKQYNNIFSNCLSTLMTESELGKANALDYLINLVNYALVWNSVTIGIVFGCLIMLVIGFKIIQKSICSVEVTILSILLNNSSSEHLTEKYNKIKIIHKELLSEVKEYSIDEYNIEANNSLINTNTINANNNNNIDNYNNALREDSNLLDKNHNKTDKNELINKTKERSNLKKKVFKYKLELKKLRDKFTQKTLKTRANRYNKRIYLFSFFFIIILMFYFCFLLYWFNRDANINSEYYYNHSNIKNLYKQNLIAMTTFKEYILKEVYNDDKIPFRIVNLKHESLKDVFKIDNNSITNNNVIDTNDDFSSLYININEFIFSSLFYNIINQDEVIDLIKKEMYKDNEVKELWNSIFNGNLCEIYNSYDKQTLDDCYSISEGILKSGLYNAINLYNSNFQSLLSNIKKKQYVINNFNNFRIIANSKLLDLYIKQAFNDFVKKYEDIYNNNSSSRKSISTIILIIYIALVIVLIITVYSIYFPKMKSKFTEVLTLLCILPSKSLHENIISSELHILELE